jgi:long-chain acyl-CoA synthetase
MSRVRVAYTAGEAIGPDLFTFYRSIGINLKQLYGSTETAVFVCLQPDNQARADTVGVPIAGVEIKVADNGEILVKSPGLLKEYYKNPDRHRRGADGRRLVPHQRRGLSGRARPPEDHRPREGRGPHHGRRQRRRHVRAQVRGEQAQVLPAHQGSGGLRRRREKVCVMINIDFDAVGNWAERRNLPYAGYTDLAQKPEVYQLIKECVEKVNADLAADALLAGSQVSRFLVLHKELDADDGELTRTNKVRRGFIAEKYDVLVDALYGGKTEQYIETQVKFEDGRTGSVSATLKIMDAKTFAPVKAAA